MMTHSSYGKNKWLTVRSHFLMDGLILVIGVSIGAALRFNDPLPTRLTDYLSAVIIAGIALPCFIYGAGLYSDRLHIRHRYRFLMLALCYLASVVLMLSLGSLNFDARLGRGVLLLSLPLTYLMLVLHHGLIISRSLGVRERVVMLVSNSNDFAIWQQLKKLNTPFYQLTGFIDTRPSAVKSEGEESAASPSQISELPEMVDRLRIDSVLCTKEQLRDPSLSDTLRNVSFSGGRLVTLVDVMEDACRLVPLALVDLEWLLHASTLPHRAYVRKWKRLFDIFISLVIGVFALPLLGLGMLWVKLASPGGPIFYTQIRSGRLGKPFRVIKLRTMRVDAEASGPQWARANDDRTILGGKTLRKFRVDEIPQLLNILRGEMSFVGPRPERPEFEEKLTQEIPYFRERLMVAPGLTGWAQVNYPYGATVEDARRKLELDLYYMKHMTLTLDLFILLDTVRIVLGGGVSAKLESHMNIRELVDRCTQHEATTANPIG
ncbi:MAG: exopolysaccharide biosynthesis polyprenyl glycosylphosphotransferase [Verrucomicrobium sp.]